MKDNNICAKCGKEIENTVYSFKCSVCNNSYCSECRKTEIDECIDCECDICCECGMLCDNCEAVLCDYCIEDGLCSRCNRGE